MSRSRSRVGTLLVLSVVALSSGACVPLDDAMAAIFGRSMRDQRSFDPYENTLLPPEGSVPFASGNMAAGPFDVNVGQAEMGPDDMPPPFTQLEMTQNPEIVDDLVNPVPATAESLARGEVLYNRVCAACHGGTGVANPNFLTVHPVMAAFPIAGPTAQRARDFTDGYIYGLIRVGRTLMPPYGHQIGHYDRWHIVNYLRQLQGAN